MTDFSDRSVQGDPAQARQNGNMPTRREVPGMPERIADIHFAIGSATRVTVLRYVLEHPNATRSALVEATGMAPAPARLALAALEERGYISADVEGDRVGRTVRYSVDRSKVSEDASAFLGWLLR